MAATSVFVTLPVYGGGTVAMRADSVIRVLSEGVGKTMVCWMVGNGTQWHAETSLSVSEVVAMLEKALHG